MDVFSNNPFADSVNGSMWTLKHEIACYIAVVFMSYFYIFRNRILLLLSTTITLILAISNILCGYKIVNLSDKFWVLSSTEYNSFITLFSFFMIGSLIYMYQDKILINYRYLLLSVIFILFSCKSGNLLITLLFTLPYLLISLCIITNIKGITRYGDFSYGMYIYAFPIQQTLMHFLKSDMNIYVYCFLSIIITFVMSILSWRFVEKPALDLKKYLINRSKNNKRRS